MKRSIALVLIVIAGSSSSLRAQLLLSPGQSYTYEFSTLGDFGNGYPPPPRGFATFYIDSVQSTPGASYTLDLFENSVSESPIATITGSGNLTATAANGWQDVQGVARVTVNSGDVFFESLSVNVYTPDGFGDYQLWSSGTVPVPEPGTVMLGALGVVGLVGMTFKNRRR